MELIDSFDGPWIIGGDWQVPPEALVASGVPCARGW